MTYNQTITLGAVTLNVNNLEKQKQFYQNIIGLHIIEESSQKVSLGIKNSNNILVNLVQLDPTQIRERVTGLYHLAFLLPTREALGQVLRHLIEIQAPLGGAADHGYSEALYLNDPEGNGIEIYRDKAEAEWDIRPNGQIKGITIELDAEGVLSAGVTSTPNMPEGTVMGHVHLTGTNFTENEHFYRDILGFNLTDDLGGHARFFGMDGYHHQIGVNNWLGEQIPNRKGHTLGINEYTIIWESSLDFNFVLEKAQKENNSIEIINEGEFKIVDPNGIMIHMELKK